MLLMQLLAWFFLSCSVPLGLYFLWYLTWPVVPARVVHVKAGTSRASRISSPSNYRFIVYEFEVDGYTRRSSRQSLFFQAGLGPKKELGEGLRVSVCKSFCNYSAKFAKYHGN